MALPVGVGPRSDDQRGGQCGIGVKRRAQGGGEGLRRHRVKAQMRCRGAELDAEVVRSPAAGRAERVRLGQGCDLGQYDNRRFHSVTPLFAAVQRSAQAICAIPMPSASR